MLLSKIRQFRQIRLCAQSVSLVGLLMVFPVTSVPAATEADAAARQADLIQQRQQQQILQDRDKVQRELRPRGADLKTLVPATTAPGVQENKCQFIHTIDIADAARLANAVREQIGRQYADRCLGVDEISEILGLITRNYIEQGHVTTRAYLPAQDLHSGVLKIVVVEGRIGVFRIEDGEANSVSVANAFPGLLGGVLDLRDLEQGMEQINRLQSNDARLDIEPGESAGESVVVVRNRPAFPAHLYTSYDNQGATSTGRHQAAATVSFDGLAGFNEFLLVSQRRSLPLGEREHGSRSESLSLNVPFGYHLLGLDLNRSRYTNQLTLPTGTQALAEGSNRINSLSWNRVMFRDQDSRLSLGAALSSKDSRNYFAGQFLDVSSRKLSVLDLRGSWSTLVGRNFVSLDLGYAQGLKTLGAKRDAAGLPDDQPHAQFHKASARLSARLPFQLGGLALVHDTEFNAQHAWQALYGSEQMLIGGIYSVRGFADTSLSGDRGYYWRNEVSLPGSVAIAAHTVSGKIFAGLDTGRVWSLAGQPAGRLTGATLGVQARWRGLILDLFHTAAISLPAGLKREAPQTWLRVSALL